MSNIYRTIIESSMASCVVDELRAKYPRFNDWWEDGWKWRLSRDPVLDATPAGPLQAHIYLLKTSAHHKDYGFPFVLTLLFVVKPDDVEILAIKVVMLE